MLEEWGRARGSGRGELNINLTRQEEKYERVCYGGSVAEGSARGGMGRGWYINYKPFSCWLFFPSMCYFYFLFF